MLGKIQSCSHRAYKRVIESLILNERYLLKREYDISLIQTNRS